jgi:hypothetical protein
MPSINPLELFKNLFPFINAQTEIEKSGNRLAATNLSDKRPQDNTQLVERNDFASFLMDSSLFYKTNRFFCVVFPPSNIPEVTEYYKKTNGGLRFVCESASIPTQTIETFDYRLNNLPAVRMPLSINYGGEVTLTFRMSKEFLERKLFLTWQESVFTYDGKNPGSRYQNEYAFNSSIILSQIDTANNKVYNTEFSNVYPVSVSGIEYNWMPGDDYVRQSVTFAFTRMFSEGTKRSSDYPSQKRINNGRVS